MYSENFISELIKLYPKVKIPFYKKAEYYLGLFLQDPAYSTLQTTLDNFKDLEKSIDIPLSKYKLSKFDLILNDWKEKGYTEKLNSIDKSIFDKKLYERHEFNNWQKDTVYISLDIKQANWQVFKRYVLEADISLTWEDYISAYNLHPVLVNSKSFRQYLFGNTNPKRIQRLQELEMYEIKRQIPCGYNVVFQNPDEIILEVKEYELTKALNMLKDIECIFELRQSVFIVTREESFGETITVRTSKDGIRELFGVEGNRFFLHYKNLILKDKITDDDLIFQVNGKQAKWLV